MTMLSVTAVLHSRADTNHLSKASCTDQAVTDLPTDSGMLVVQSALCAVPRLDLMVKERKGSLLRDMGQCELTTPHFYHSLWLTRSWAVF